MKPYHWTPEDIATAARIWKQPHATTYAKFHAIAAAIDRTYPSVRGRYGNFGATFAPLVPSHHYVTEDPRVPASILAERDARLSRSPRDNTAWIMGDPLPGCSALERRA